MSIESIQSDIVCIRVQYRIMRFNYACGKKRLVVVAPACRYIDGGGDVGGGAAAVGI